MHIEINTTEALLILQGLEHRKKQLVHYNGEDSDSVVTCKYLMEKIEEAVRGNGL